MLDDLNLVLCLLKMEHRACKFDWNLANIYVKGAYSKKFPCTFKNKLLKAIKAWLVSCVHNISKQSLMHASAILINMKYYNPLTCSVGYTRPRLSGLSSIGPGNPWPGTLRRNPALAQHRTSPSNCPPPSMHWPLQSTLVPGCVWLGWNMGWSRGYQYILKRPKWPGF